MTPQPTAAAVRASLDTPTQWEMPASLDPTDRGWDFFTDDALIELLADASYELSRRGRTIQVVVK